jgi:hypothetical protein
MSVQEPRIYLKAGELKNIPASFSHHLLPILFAEAGEMPNSTGRPKRCSLVVNLSGVAFFRPEKMTLKLSQFISTYTITKITNAGDRRILLSFSSSPKRSAEQFQTTWFSCEHADEAVAWIRSARAALFWNSADPISIQLIGFKPESENFHPAYFLVNRETIAQVQYVCYSYRYNVQPRETLINLFRSLNPEGNKSLVFDDTCDGPENLKSLIVPLTQAGQFTTVHFKGFIPYAACRLAHFLLRHGTVRLVVFEDYQTLVPAQLRLQKVQCNEPISFIFSKCKLKDDVMDDLIEQLSQFNGEYQRFTFANCTLGAAQMQAMLTMLSTVRSFQCLEVLELDGLPTKLLKGSKIEAGIDAILLHCRFLHRISLSNWGPVGLRFAIGSFLDNCQLTELHLEKHDLRQGFQGFELPGTIRLLNFSRSAFTTKALDSLFMMVGNSVRTVSLILQELVMQKEEMQSFFGTDRHSRGLSTVHELDWSGNVITRAASPRFIQFFLGENRLRFLVLDGIFRTSSIAHLQFFMELLRPYKLWGLSLRGSLSANFSGNFRPMLQALGLIDGISLLHIDGQKMTDADSALLLDFLAHHECIREISCDDSSLSEDAFLEFYQALIQPQFLAIGRPLKDISRLFCRPGNISPNSPAFHHIVSSLRDIHNSTGRSVRSTYLDGKYGSPDLDLGQLYRLSNRFPLCFIDCTEPDYFGLRQNHRAVPLWSIWHLRVLHQCRTLQELHRELLWDCNKRPRYRSAPRQVGTDTQQASSDVCPAASMPGTQFRLVDTEPEPEVERGPMITQPDGRDIDPHNLIELGDGFPRKIWAVKKPGQWVGPAPIFLPETDVDEHEEEVGEPIFPLVVENIPPLAFVAPNQKPLRGFATPDLSETTSDSQDEDESESSEGYPVFKVERYYEPQKRRSRSSSHEQGVAMPLYLSGSLLANAGDGASDSSDTVKPEIANRGSGEAAADFRRAPGVRANPGEPQEFPFPFQVEPGSGGGRRHQGEPGRMHPLLPGSPPRWNDEAVEPSMEPSDPSSEDFQNPLNPFPVPWDDNLQARVAKFPLRGPISGMLDDLPPRWGVDSLSPVVQILKADFDLQTPAATTRYTSPPDDKRAAPGADDDQPVARGLGPRHHSVRQAQPPQLFARGPRGTSWPAAAEPAPVRQPSPPATQLRMPQAPPLQTPMSQPQPLQVPPTLPERPPQLPMQPRPTLLGQGPLGGRPGTSAQLRPLQPAGLLAAMTRSQLTGPVPREPLPDREFPAVALVGPTTPKPFLNPPIARTYSKAEEIALSPSEPPVQVIAHPRPRR